MLSGISPFVETKNMDDLTSKTGNIYASVHVIGRRANQMARELKEELHAKLSEFATTSDNLEEVFENREQIEISRYYEKMPNPALIATSEFMQDKTYFRLSDTIDMPVETPVRETAKPDTTRS